VGLLALCLKAAMLTKRREEERRNEEKRKFERGLAVERFAK